MKRSSRTPQEEATSENAQVLVIPLPRLASLPHPSPLLLGFPKTFFFFCLAATTQARRKILRVAIKGALKEMAKVSTRVEELQVSTAQINKMPYTVVG